MLSVYDDSNCLQLTARLQASDVLSVAAGLSGSRRSAVVGGSLEAVSVAEQAEVDDHLHEAADDRAQLSVSQHAVQIGLVFEVLPKDCRPLARLPHRLDESNRHALQFRLVDCVLRPTPGRLPGLESIDLLNGDSRLEGCSRLALADVETRQDRGQPSSQAEVTPVRRRCADSNRSAACSCSSAGLGRLRRGE